MRAVERLRSQVTRPLLVALLGGVVLLLPAISCVFMPAIFVDKPGTATAEKIFVESRLEMTRQVQRQFTATAAVEQTAAARQTQAAAQTATRAVEVTATRAAQETATAMAQATQVAISAATQQAVVPAARVAELAEEGLLPSAQGRYYVLSDFQQEKNEIGAYIWWRSEHQPHMFVLQTHIEYEAPDGPQDRAKAACGFMLWENGGSDWLRAVYTLNGNVQVNAVRDTRFVSLGETYHGIPPFPTGGVDMTLVANETQVIVYIDGEKIKTTRIPTGQKQSGYLSYTLTSGSAREFGLRCRYSDTWLWVVE